MDTHQKGYIAEVQVELAASKKGWICSRPTRTTRYDLILDDGRKLYRTQVKYLTSLSTKTDGAYCLTFGNGVGSPDTYTKSEIDLILVYLPKSDQVVRIEPKEFSGKKSINIRFEPPQNNHKGVFMAEEHLF
jgi:hypothetical protein